MTDNTFQLPITNLSTKDTKRKLVKIPLDLLPPNEYLLSDSPTKALIEDIAIRGQVTPIQVTKDADDSYIIIDGRRRVKALRALAEAAEDKKEFDSVIAIVIDAPLSMQSILGLAAVENNLRTENPLTDLQAIRYLMDNNPQISEQEISRQTGIPVARIRKRLKLNKLIPEIAQVVLKGNISVSVAEGVAKLSEQKQKSLLNKFIESGKITHDDVIVSQRATVAENVALLPDFPDIEEQEEKEYGYVIIDPNIFTVFESEDEANLAISNLGDSGYVCAKILRKVE